LARGFFDGAEVRHDATLARGLYAIAFMAAHFRQDGLSFVKDAGFAGAAAGGRAVILDETQPPGTLAAKRAMTIYAISEWRGRLL
jgi:hypothetical protein